MTVEERMRVTEAWMASTGDRLPVIVHVGHACLTDCQTLAAHAQRAGATAIGCLAPYFFKPKSVHDLVEFCARVAAAAPDLPFYYYHLPSVTGVNFPMVEFLAAAADRIPNLGGIKFTYEDLMDYSACVRFDGGRFDILFGRDEALLAGLVLGAKGAIGSTYNYMAPIYHAIIGAFDRGDVATARAVQARAADIVAVMLRHGGLAAGKAMMAFVGIDCGPVRQPLHDLGTEQRESLRRDLEKASFPFRA